MRGSQSDSRISGKHTGPFILGLFKQILDVYLQIFISIAIVAEFECPTMISAALHLIIQFCVDEFKDLLEHINAGIGEDFILHLLNKTFEGFLLADQFVLLDKIIYRPTFGQYILQLLCSRRDARNVLKVIWVLPVVI